MTLDDLRTYDFSKLSYAYKLAWIAHFKWLLNARAKQLCPPIDSELWAIWLLQAGRGFGKSRSVNEALRYIISFHSNVRVACIAPRDEDVVKVSIEGESGVLQSLPKEMIKSYSPSNKTLELINGSMVQFFSSEAYERLRGYQFHYVLLDEVFAYRYMERVWEQVGFCLRLGEHPKILIASTPRPCELNNALVSRRHDDLILITGSSYENTALSKVFFKNIERLDPDSAQYKQEVLGELLSDISGVIIKKQHILLYDSAKALPHFDSVIVSLDTAYSAEPSKTELKRKNFQTDFTAWTVWGVSSRDKSGKVKIYLLDCDQARLEFSELVKKIRSLSQSYFGAPKADPSDPKNFVIQPKFGQHYPTIALHAELQRGQKPNVVLIEDIGSGKSAISSVRAQLAMEGIRTVAFNPNRDSKFTRLHSASHLFYHGLVMFPCSDNDKNRPKKWCEELIYQLTNYSGAESLKFDDFVDSTSQAMIYIGQKYRVSVHDPLQDSRSSSSGYRDKTPENPYTI